MTDENSLQYLANIVAIADLAEKGILPSISLKDMTREEIRALIEAFLKKF